MVEASWEDGVPEGSWHPAGQRVGGHQRLQEKEPVGLVEAGMEVGKAEEEEPAGTRSRGWELEVPRRVGITFSLMCVAQEVMWPQGASPRATAKFKRLAHG